MSNAFTRALSTPVPQSEAVDSRQVKNNAGGFVFTVDDKARLERFLILGTNGGTYYVNERDLTKQNINWLIDFIKRDGMRVIDTVHTVSTEGRAYRNSPAIFALALVFKYGSAESKAAAKFWVPEICRTSTHLFEFAQYVELLGGWGRAKRSAIAGWYQDKAPDKIAYQLVKYRQRDGWTHRDLLRLSHARIDSTLERFASRWYKDEQNSGLIVDERPELDIVRAFSVAQEQTSVRGILDLLSQDYAHNLPWEALPTQFLKEASVWKQLFANGQLKGQALVRNITRLSRIGAFDDMVFARDYADCLVDEQMIQRTRLHPINYLNALVVHENGQTDRGGFSNFRQKDWNTNPVIMDALNEGFYKAFKYVEPANKRTFIGLDVSGSMSNNAAGLDMSCAMVGAALAMTIARTEPYYQVFGFSEGQSNKRHYHHNWESKLTDLGISPSMNLNDVMRKTANQTFGATDCALPMKYAQENNIEVDTFVVLTDNETWFGDIHPHIALKNYRKSSNIDAKLIVVGMTATNFTIADPTDHGMLDVVGCDSNLPKLISEFSAGRV